MHQQRQDYYRDVNPRQTQKPMSSTPYNDTLDPRTG
jgi:hypothetical protein